MSSADSYLVTIDELLGQPFPAEKLRDEWQEYEYRENGPGYHIRVLRVSHDFWDEEPEEFVLEQEAEVKAEFESLNASVRERWGQPREVDLWPYIRRASETADVPEPVNTVCDSATSMNVWMPPGTGRWVGLAFGQEDSECPFEILLAVGEESTVPSRR